MPLRGVPGKETDFVILKAMATWPIKLKYSFDSLLGTEVPEKTC